MPGRNNGYTIIFKIQDSNGQEIPWSRSAFELKKEQGMYQAVCVAHEFLRSNTERMAYEAKLFEQMEEQCCVYEKEQNKAGQKP